MTRRDTNRLWTRSLAALAVALGLLSSGVQAAKPPAPPAATGTIYFKSGGNVAAVKADGSGLASNLLPGLIGPNTSGLYFPAPCRLPQGSSAVHDRWWLLIAQTGTYDEVTDTNGATQTNVPHYDLVAVRSNPANRSQLIVVQVTDLYGVFNCALDPCWSNDSNDAGGSFATIRGADIRDTFVEDPDDQTTSYDQRQQIPAQLRLPLAAMELTLEGTGFVPFGPDSLSEAEFDALLLPIMSFRIIPGPRDILSPDGAFYVKNDPSYISGTVPDRLVIADAIAQYPANSRLLWDGNSGNPRQSIDAVWSPDGQTIAFVDGAASPFSGGDIWTVPASGASAPTRLVPVSTKGTSTFVYYGPVWSPDSRFLAVQKKEFATSGGTIKNYQISRVAVADGKVQDLALVLRNQTWDGIVLRWGADN